MTPADRPPREPDRGDPARKMIAGSLFFAAFGWTFAASILSGTHMHHRDAVVWSAFAVAAVLAVAAVAVLAGKGRQQ